MATTKSKKPTKTKGGKETPIVEARPLATTSLDLPLASPAVPRDVLALNDENDISPPRSDLVSGDPNRYAHMVIESVTVTEARYCGRSNPPGTNPLEIPLSPWLTTIIGGPGSGKSTLIELMRLALRRDDELPATLKADFDAFRKVPSGRDDRGALTGATQILVVCRKDGQRYRIRWANAGTVPAIEEEHEAAWTPAVGEIRQRFPVRIFSQGQILALAKDSQALLRIVSESPEVALTTWRAQWQAEEGRFLSLRAKLRELDKQLAERPGLEGSLADVTRKLAVFEDAAHAQVLKDYQRSQRQHRVLENWGTNLGDIETRLRTTAERLAPLDVDTSMFAASVASEQAIVASIASSAASMLDIATQISKLADHARDHYMAWMRKLKESAWSKDSELIAERYRVLAAELAARGVADLGQYGALVQQRRVFEERLRALNDLRTTIEQVRGEAASSLRALGSLRAQLTARRNTFIEDVLHGNPHVRMTVEPYGQDPRSAETDFRKVIERHDGKFSDDILSEDGSRGCLADLYRDLPDEHDRRTAELARRIAALKENLEQLARNPSERGWFARHLQQLPPESIDRLQMWFPADELAVSYSPRGDGRGFRSLEQASPGQKTAAILAFLLAHGDEPIILDQPEDDLDNELIYKLIVAQLRANKNRRQVIVVTHNANIVVNGDAELILVMESSGGQCRLARRGSLQSRDVRDQVCAMMEGGREALEQRYRRIIGGDDHV